MQQLHQMSPFKEGSVGVVRLTCPALVYFIFLIYIYIIYMYIKSHRFKCVCNISFIMHLPEDGHNFARNMQQTCTVYKIPFNVYVYATVGFITISSKFISSVMLGRVYWQIVSEVSKYRSASIFRVKHFKCLFLDFLRIQPFEMSVTIYQSTLRHKQEGLNLQIISFSSSDCYYYF